MSFEILNHHWERTDWHDGMIDWDLGIDVFDYWFQRDLGNSGHENNYIRVEQWKLEGDLLFSLTSMCMHVVMLRHGDFKYDYQCSRLVWDPGSLQWANRLMMDCLRESNLWVARICNVPNIIK